MKTFDITYNQQIAGRATLTVEGLYYQISCSCNMPDKAIYRIYAKTDKETKDLGVCIPDGDAVVLEKKIPIKQIEGDRLSFQICKGNSQKGEPVYKDKPFEYIDKLEKAHLEVHDGKPFIVLK